MKKEEWDLLKTINEEQYSIIENRIKDEYKQSKRANVADAVSLGMFWLGYVILITLFQNMTVIALSGQRKYKNNWWISLLGLNLLFFLYFGEQRRFNKYFNKAIEKEELPESYKGYKAGYDRVNALTNKEIDLIKTTMLFTTDVIPGKTFETLGMVYGSSVRSKNAITDIGSGIKSMKGGKMLAYSKLMNETRSEAFDSMITNATRRFEKFDAILNIRISTSEIAKGSSEILVYGTVIKYKK